MQYTYSKCRLKKKFTKDKYSHAGNRTRAAVVRATNPNH